GLLLLALESVCWICDSRASRRLRGWGRVRSGTGRHRGPAPLDRAGRALQPAAWTSAHVGGGGHEIRPGGRRRETRVGERLQRRIGYPGLERLVPALPADRGRVRNTRTLQPLRLRGSVPARRLRAG